MVCCHTWLQTTHPASLKMRATNASFGSKYTRSSHWCHHLEILKIMQIKAKPCDVKHFTVIYGLDCSKSIITQNNTHTQVKKQSTNVAHGWRINMAWLHLMTGIHGGYPLLVCVIYIIFIVGDRIHVASASRHLPATQMGEELLFTWLSFKLL